MQAIQTKYLGPSGSARPRGPRIVARCAAFRHTFPWDYELNHEQNHAYAAERLAQRLGWLHGHRLESGSLRDGSYAHVLVAESPGALASRDLATRAAKRALTEKEP